MSRFLVRHALLPAFAAASVFVPFAARAAAPAVETIVMVRHAEKPASSKDDVGQLTCQGENRALALPAVLLSRYGTPDAIFAAQPNRSYGDAGTKYALRSLATIEPTAVAAARPVMLKYEADDIRGLEHSLMKAKYASSTVFVAWEHKNLEALAKALVKDAGGDDSVVPKWKGDDFDGIYLVRLRREGSSTSVSFETEAEHLDGQPATCPGMPPA